MTASDDGGNVALAWELVGGGHSAFDLSTDGALSVAVGVLLDFELQPLHTLHVKVTGGSFGDGPSSLSTSSAVEIGEIGGSSGESDSYIESILLRGIGAAPSLACPPVIVHAPPSGHHG